MRNHFLSLVLLLPAFATAAAPDSGGWTLVSENSNLSFFSVKNGAVGEVHRFLTLDGRISPLGQARISIELDSVETAIPIRNERMREMLFETPDYPAAEVVAQVDTRASGEVDFTGELTLHGATVPVSTRVLVQRREDGSVVVSSLDPIVVTASLFGLAEGIDRLRQIAGLQSIATAVPVNFVLTFAPERALALR
jgi:polyisoprenoid-binding protein YceI